MGRPLRRSHFGTHSDWRQNTASCGCRTKLSSSFSFVRLRPPLATTGLSLALTGGLPHPRARNSTATSFHIGGFSDILCCTALAAMEENICLVM